MHNNAEKITDVWKILSQLFEKYNNKFSEEESASFIMNFNGTINDFKAMLSKSEYSNSVYLINFDENDIKNMELNSPLNQEKGYQGDSISLNSLCNEWLLLFV